MIVISPFKEMNKQRGNANKRGNKQKKRGRVGRGEMLVTPFPVRRTARMRYVQTVAVGGAAVGVGDFVVYSPSSLYDPEVAVGGHQPMYYDQLLSATGPYTKFLVTGARFRVHFSNFSSASTPVQIVVYVSPVSTSPASITQAMEKPWSQKRLLSVPAGGGANGTITIQCASEKALGISKAHLLTDDYYAGAYNANPSVNWFITMCVYGVSGVCSVACNVEMDIDTILYSLGNTSTS